MTTQTTINQVAISARLRVDDHLQVSWPNPIKLGTFFTQVVSTRRDGDDERALEFNLERLRAVCQDRADKYPLVAISIELSAKKQFEVARCCQQTATRIYDAELVATLILAFQPTDEYDAPVTKDDALQFAEQLITALHNRM